MSVTCFILYHVVAGLIMCNNLGQVVCSPVPMYSGLWDRSIVGSMGEGFRIRLLSALGVNGLGFIPCWPKKRVVRWVTYVTSMSYYLNMTQTLDNLSVKCHLWIVDGGDYNIGIFVCVCVCVIVHLVVSF